MLRAFGGFFWLDAAILQKIFVSRETYREYSSFCGLLHSFMLFFVCLRIIRLLLRGKSLFRFLQPSERVFFAKKAGLSIKIAGFIGFLDCYTKYYQFRLTGKCVAAAYCI